jgi:hypothetical protein
MPMGKWRRDAFSKQGGRMIGDRWGVTDDEVAGVFPCDHLVHKPALQAWRAVTVNARPDRLWPWVAQIRLAPYSYDWIDNLGRRSPQYLCGLADPVPGERFTTAARLRLGQVLSVDQGRQLTGTIAGVVISYVLEPDQDRTRLLMKISGPYGRMAAPLLGTPLRHLVAPLGSVADLIMARRQLLNLKHLAESPPEQPECLPPRAAL